MYITEELIMSWLSLNKIDNADRDKILCISDSANTLGSAMNPIILLPAMRK